MTRSLSRLLAAMTCAASLSVYATDEETSYDKQQHKPSQAALDACKGQAEKTACSFVGPNDKDHKVDSDAN